MKTPTHSVRPHACVTMVALFVLGAATLMANADPLPLPGWPQKFDIGGPESANFGLVVMQPGAVVVDIQTNGAPVVATLHGATPQAGQQAGSGNLHLVYQVTARDLQISPFWTIQVALVPPAAAAGARASGTVMVHAPPLDPAAVQALLAKANAQTQASAQALKHAQMGLQAQASRAAQMDSVLNGRRAQYDQQRQQVRAQMYAQLQPLAAATQARLANRVGTRGVAPAVAVTSMSRVPSAEVLAAKVPAPATASSSQAITAAGSGPAPQTVVANPYINSLSVNQGQPGDPVMISGSGFAAGGEVHFIINPGKDVVAHVDIWSDNQVFVEVPDASGILGFNGLAYVIRAGDNVRSNLVPFHFNPGLEFRDLRSTTDRLLGQPYDSDGYLTTANQIWRDNDNPFAGYQGNDVLFMSTQLKNGWVVDDAFVYCVITPNGCSGGVAPLVVPRGSSALATTVHWWIGTGSGFAIAQNAYTFAVRIVGPKGVPDGVLVP
jgi:hypothetical protein